MKYFVFLYEDEETAAPCIFKSKVDPPNLGARSRTDFNHQPQLGACSDGFKPAGGAAAAAAAAEEAYESWKIAEEATPTTAKGGGTGSEERTKRKRRRFQRKASVKMEAWEGGVVASAEPR